MIIVSQKKDEIINFENINNIYVSSGAKIIACANMEDCDYTLGNYKTKERAKEVLQEIIHIYGECNASCISTGYGYVRNEVYEMPED